MSDFRNNGGSSLGQILRLAGKHFHDRRTTNDRDDESMSLQQLVPIHQSLLEVGATNQLETDTTMSDAACKSWLGVLLNALKDGMVEDDDNLLDSDKNLQFCRELLQGAANANDCQRLLVWQYLLYRARSTNSVSPMEWLSSIVFGYLLPLKEQASISDELMDVLLDLSLEWVFSATSTTTTTTSHDDWSKLRQDLLAETRSTQHDVVSMPLSSKIAAKIVVLYLSRNESDETNNPAFFLSLYYEHLWCNLELCCDHHSVDLLSDVSQSLLLPLLKEYQTTVEATTHSAELERLLWGLFFPLLEKKGLLDIEDNDDNTETNERQHLLLIATTTLCPLLPWYWKQQQKQQPQDSKHVWNLIFVCLQQGRRSVVQARECDTRRGKGGGVFGTGGLAAMLRRRALYLLDIVTSSTTENGQDASIWKDYILCADTFEMEGERHIIDQIWPVVAKLMREAWRNELAAAAANHEGIPLLTPSWIELLLGRILSSEQLAVRKLGVFRILQALGRSVTSESLRRSMEEDREIVDSTQSSMDIVTTSGSSTNNEGNDASKTKKRTQKQHQQPKKKKKTSKGSSSLDVLPTEMMLRFLSPQTFLWDVLVPSWDSLGGSSVGYTIHLVEEKNKKGGNSSGSPVEKFSKIDMVPLFCQTIRNYAILAETMLSETVESGSISPSLLFWKGLWDWDRVGSFLSAKTFLSVYNSVSDLIEKEVSSQSDTNMSDGEVSPSIKAVPMDDDDLKAIRRTYGKLFRNGLMVLKHRTQFLQILSLMLSKATSNFKCNKWTPVNVLSLLALFSASYFPSLDAEDVVDWSIEKEEMLTRLGTFVHQFESQTPGQNQVPYAVTVGATLAVAFVTGQVSLSSASGGLPLSSRWSPVEGASKDDQEMAWAISLFSTMAVSGQARHTSGELLWPAIHKGLSQSPGVILTKGHSLKAEVVARALLLLENGCRLRQLSGLGNGDLVVNPKTQQIMPPPPNIEQMLQNSVAFIQWHIRKLLATESHAEETESDGKNKRFTGSFACLISQFKVLHQSYPSSQAISGVMDELLHKSTEDLSELLDGDHASSGEGDVKKLLLVGLIYGACSCGAQPKKQSYASFCRLLLRTGLSTAGEGQPSVWVKSSRSIIQYGRWAAISCILPKLLEETSDSVSDNIQKDVDKLVDEVLKEGIIASSITPSDAIKPLFDCIIMSSRKWICVSSKYDRQQVETLYLNNLTDITKTLLSLVKQSTRSRESAYMLNEFCALVFQPKLLQEEYERIKNDPVMSRTPIRDAFRQLVKMAGRQKPQITRAVLCRITVGWLSEVNSDDKGVSAIPYRDDIVQLLIHKEAKQEESSSNQSMGEIPKHGVTELPANTNELSVTRAFLLVFFCQLPSPGAGLDPIVKTELVHYVIMELLKNATPEKGTHPSLVMKGTPKYCMKMRGWQALCILSRFVTDEIAVPVCETVFQAMNELLHNQIRYFLENFTIKCATKHPAIFGEAFLKDISRTDLSLQHISSLMIMGGNFIMGKYQLDYLTRDDIKKTRSKRVLAGVLPWLSSTQGFSRAIAQLMVYQLIPRVISVSSDNFTSASEPSEDESNWFLRSTYNFLHNNREMKRLRNKQTKFFEQYDCEAMCTPEGVFSIRVDEADEADPVHMIDAMKESLRSTYDEAHESDAPSWKHVEEMLVEDGAEDEDGDSDDNIGSTVQRKIIPLDSLNLALEDLKKQRLMNAKGAHKQNLIVCASLVDKVPNLAGLARTCEIFAAQSLVMPDMSVAKMDNFQSISVGAVDWIDMEEVKEEALLSWLLQKKTEGFWIVGLEQTSSSVPLHQVEIPDFVATNNKTVLLLGKEKEGIPVQFLQAVDKCVEIPQFGLIRSLNVHVSGAITIWELTRRTRLMAMDQPQGR